MEKELIILLGNEREKMYLDLNTHSHINQNGECTSKSIWKKWSK